MLTALYTHVKIHPLWLSALVVLSSGIKCIVLLLCRLNRDACVALMMSDCGNIVLMSLSITWLVFYTSKPLCRKTCVCVWLLLWDDSKLRWLTVTGQGSTVCDRGCMWTSLESVQLHDFVTVQNTSIANTHIFCSDWIKGILYVNKCLELLVCRFCYIKTEPGQLLPLNTYLKSIIMVTRFLSNFHLKTE